MKGHSKLSSFLMIAFVTAIAGVLPAARLSAGDQHDAKSHGYVIVVSRSTHGNQAWRPVVDELSKKHGATALLYSDHLTEVLGQLREMHPRFTCFVATPEEATRQFVADAHRIVRRFDEDPWMDTQWGILTGHQPEDALRIVRETQPLVIRKVASGTEVALEMCTEGLWYDELVKGKRVAKSKGEKAVESEGPDDTTRALAETLVDYQADLFVTSGHATERDWMIGFRYRNGFFRSRDGQLFGETVDKQLFPISSANPKVYLPIGNCLMGHIDSRDAMALAWMKSVGVRQMAGYTVPTWYGYAGWGLLDYFVEQPGRYTLSEAFFANQQALLHRLYTSAPGTIELNPEPGSSARGIEVTEDGKSLGVRPMDITGLLHDRDVVAFYGDPAWEARMAPAVTAYEQTLTVDDDLYTLTITPNRGRKSFEPVNTNGAQRGWRPVIQLLDQRIEQVKLLEGQDLKPLIADDFILVPNPRECDPDRTYRISFRARPAAQAAEAH